MDECPICLLSLEHPITSMQCCKQLFHTACIVRCLDVKPNCPMCRTEYLSIVTVHVPEHIVIQNPKRNYFWNAFLFVTVSCFVTLGLFGCKYT